MNYKELRDSFHTLINRTDCDDNDADGFIKLGLRRVERILRTPFQETTQELEIVNGRAGLPIDCIGVKEVIGPYGPLSRVSSNQASEGYPGYMTHGGSLMFSGDYPEKVILHYFTEFEGDLEDHGLSNYTVIIPDVVVYASLLFACDVYTDERKASFETTFEVLKGEVQEMTYEDMMNGNMQITPIGEGVA